MAAESKWPTAPGWYWVRWVTPRDQGHVEPAKVSAGPSNSTLWMVAGQYAYPSEPEWSTLEWGPRIETPEGWDWSEAWGHSRILLPSGAERMQVRDLDAERVQLRFMVGGVWRQPEACPSALWRGEGRFVAGPIDVYLVDAGEDRRLFALARSPEHARELVRDHLDGQPGTRFASRWPVEVVSDYTLSKLYLDPADDEEDDNGDPLPRITLLDYRGQRRRGNLTGVLELEGTRIVEVLHGC